MSRAKIFPDGSHPVNISKSTYKELEKEATGIMLFPSQLADKAIKEKLIKMKEERKK